MGSSPQMDAPDWTIAFDGDVIGSASDPNTQIEAALLRSLTVDRTRHSEGPEP
jgi:hypothetical protein